jgi:hypothetical protein
MKGSPVRVRASALAFRSFQGLRRTSPASSLKHCVKRPDALPEGIALREPLSRNSGVRPLQAVIAGKHLHGYSLDFERYSGEVAG